jgi:hypothetical protein
MGHRGDGRGTQQRVGEVEQGVGAACEAGVQLVAEGAKPREGEGGIGMAAQPDSPGCLQAT